MARGGPRKADGPAKKGQRSQFKVLTNHDTPVPPMPPAEQWITVPGMIHIPKDKRTRELLTKVGIDPDEAIKRTDRLAEGFINPQDFEPAWSLPVCEWWASIWSSPMASEFIESDIYSLYFACLFFHESLNPFYKISDRLAAYKQYAAICKDYGLTPAAREQLRWHIAQGTAAQNRTEQLRAASSQGKADNVDLAALYLAHSQ